MDWKPLIGLAIAALSACGFCVTNVMVKDLSHVDSFLLSTTRFWIIALMSTPVAVSRSSKSSPFPAGKRWLLLMRSLLGATNLMVHFYSLQVNDIYLANMDKGFFKSIFRAFQSIYY